MTTTKRTRTKRVRIIAQPERIYTKDHRRDYGKERRHPKTIGWRIKTTTR
jgi:hypothetical protein